jgi:hypothetical protein
MPARLPSLTLVRLVATLLLATIGLQAAQPFEGPSRPIYGSAFSAATVDVALATQRRAEPARAALVPQPTLLPVEPAVARLVPDIVHSLAVRPDSTGPPTMPVLDRRAPPRAPPLS